MDGGQRDGVIHDNEEEGGVRTALNTGDCLEIITICLGMHIFLDFTYLKVI